MNNFTGISYVRGYGLDYTHVTMEKSRVLPRCRMVNLPAEEKESGLQL